MKKRCQHKCFLVNIATFLSTPIFKNICDLLPRKLVSRMISKTSMIVITSFVWRIWSWNMVIRVSEVSFSLSFRSLVTARAETFRFWWWQKIFWIVYEWVIRWNVSIISYSFTFTFHSSILKPYFNCIFW